jgi:thioesterase domain-containing protein
MRIGDEERMQLHIVTLTKSGNRSQLICIPGAGGEISIFKDMASLIGEERSIYAIDTREFFDFDRKFTVEQLANLCLVVLGDVKLEGPTVFCGYSFGALVAYEVAIRLRCLGKNVRAVAMIDTGNPAFRHTVHFAEAKQLQKAYLTNRIYKYCRLLVDGNVRVFLGSLLALFASRFGLRTRRVVRRVFSALNRPMPTVFQNNDSALFEAWSAYKPPHSDLSLLLFCGEYRRTEYGGNQSLGWDLCASGVVDVELAPAGHVEMMKLPNVCGFATRLSEIMWQ